VLELIAQGSRTRRSPRRWESARNGQNARLERSDQVGFNDRSAAIVVAIRRGIVTLLCCCSVPCCRPRRSRREKYYSQTGWTRKEGPDRQPDLGSRAGSTRLHLVGTKRGLVRFDGVRFLTSREIGLAAVPTDAVSSVLVACDGLVVDRIRRMGESAGCRRTGAKLPLLDWSPRNRDLADRGSRRYYLGRKCRPPLSTRNGEWESFPAEPGQAPNCLTDMFGTVAATCGSAPPRACSYGGRTMIRLSLVRLV